MSWGLLRTIKNCIICIKYENGFEAVSALNNIDGWFYSNGSWTNLVQCLSKLSSIME